MFAFSLLKYSISALIYITASERLFHEIAYSSAHSCIKSAAKFKILSQCCSEMMKKLNITSILVDMGQDFCTIVQKTQVWVCASVSNIILSSHSIHQVQSSQSERIVYYKIEFDSFIGNPCCTLKMKVIALCFWLFHRLQFAGMKILLIDIFHSVIHEVYLFY